MAYIDGHDFLINHGLLELGKKKKKLTEHLAQDLPKV